MKTLQEVFDEIMSNEVLKKKFSSLGDMEAIAIEVKNLGCEATPEEIEMFLKKSSKKTVELSNEELDKVAAGASCNHPMV